MQKNRSLIDAWNAEVPLLESILKSTSCAAMLTDGTGVLIAATCAGRSHEHIMPIATRIGVNLSEEAVGTTAPGVVARTGQAVNVVGAEHCFDSVKVMSCSAAPIRDRTGLLAGVLDVSSELIEFGFDAASVVGLFASSMENRLLMATSGASCSHLQNNCSRLSRVPQFWARRRTSPAWVPPSPTCQRPLRPSRKSG